MSGQQARIWGRWGEALAAEDLRKRGYRVVAAGYYCRFGEIDLIAENRDSLIFVEVKLRAADAIGMGREWVDRRKQQRLRATAELYLAQHPTDKQPRFDVAEIVRRGEGGEATGTITWIENAF